MALHLSIGSLFGRAGAGLAPCGLVLGLTACQFGTAFYPGGGADGGGAPDAATPPGADASLPAPDTGPTCENECTLGAGSCATSGTGTQVCVAGPDGCTRWEADESCGPREVCQSSQCVCEDSPCTPGETRCGPTGGVETCQAPDADGCTHWGAETGCSTGLVCEPNSGQCHPDTPTGCFPLNECDYAGQITCTSTTRYRECVVRPDGCLEWDCAS